MASFLARAAAAEATASETLITGAMGSITEARIPEVTASAGAKCSFTGTRRHVQEPCLRALEKVPCR